MKDLETKKFQTMEDVHNFLSDRSQTDIWVMDYSPENKVIGINNTPIMKNQIREEVTNLIATDEAIEETMAGMGLLLQFPLNGVITTIPLRYTAHEPLFARAGLTGKTIRSTGERAQARVLDPKVKAEWLTYGLSLYDTMCKVLIRDGKVATVRSEKYEILNAEDLVRELELHLCTQWSDFTFDSSEASHEFTVIRYLLNDEKSEDIMSKNLINAGFQFKRFKIGVKFVTSDTGDSAASLYPFVYLDYMEVPLGNTLNLKHSTGASLDKWINDILPRLATSTLESLEKINTLSKIRIKNSGGCLRKTAYDLKLPQKSSLVIGDKMDSMFPNGCSALDIYYTLFEIVDHNEGKKGYTPTQKLKFQDIVSQALYINLKDNDIHFEWK